MIKKNLPLCLNNVCVTFIFCALFTTLLSLKSVAQSTANRINYLENFNSVGYPTNIPSGSYWKFTNEIYPSQNRWNEFIPGDGNAYITVDANINNDTDDVHPFQTLEFGGVAQNHRLEVRMKGAVVDGGLVGFLFTYRQVGEIFNEIDIEVVARDSAVPSHETLPSNGGWTDARFNTWGDANENTNEPFTGTMKPVVNEQNERISLIDNQFHTYTIDWRDDRIDFFIDGVIQETITTSVASGVAEVIFGFRQLPWAGAFNWSGTHTLVVDYLKIEPLENITFALNDTFVADEDRPNSFNVLANDSSNTSIVSFDNESAQGFPITANGNLLSYTPSGGFLGQDSFNYTIQDSNGVQASAIARITVQEYIEPLNANADSITVAPGSSNTPINVVANDFYGPSGPHPSHPITLPGGKIATASNQGGIIEVVNGKVNYTPLIGFTGVDSFVYTLTDSSGYADAAIVTITVGGNIPAVANNDIFTVVNNAATNLNVLANDNGSGLSILSFDVNSASGFSITRSNSNLTYTPNGSFTGSDSFSYTIVDANGVQSTANVVLTVNPVVVVAGPINAVNDAITVAPGSSNTPVNVTTNDNFGVNGPNLLYPLTLTNGKVFHVSDKGGDISIVNGKVNYSTPNGFIGSDTFTYTITDSRGFASQGVVTVTVGGNIPAVANNDTFTVVNNAATNLNVLANDNGSGLSILSFDVNSASGFSITRSNSNLTYTPNGSFTGSDSFSYTIVDANGVQSTANVVLTVNPVVVVAGPINAVNDAITVAPASSNTPVNVTANDSFGINGPHPLFALTLTNGKVFHASDRGGDISIVNGKVNYSAPNGFTGIDTFTYTITDSRGFASQGVVTVTVGGNIPAVANNDTFTVVNNAATNLNVLANDNGSGLSILSFDVNSASGFSITRSNSNLTYTPNGGFTGTDSFSYTIVDTNGVQSTANVTLTVNSVVVVAGPISAVNDAITVTRNSLNTPVNVTANDSFGINGPNATHALTLTNGKVFHVSDKGGDISIVNGKVNYSAPNGFIGTDTFTYTITDARGFASQGVVTVTVNSIASRIVSKKINEEVIIENKFSIVDNSFVTYPNPSRGYLKTTLSSGLATQATVFLIDVTGKVVYSSPVKLEKGINTFEINASLSAGIVFMKVVSSEMNFGTKKIVFY